MGGTLVKLWWTLVEPCLRPPRTTPEPIWAETPKLSAVGERRRERRQDIFANTETNMQTADTIITRLATRMSKDELIRDAAAEAGVSLDSAV